MRRHSLRTTGYKGIIEAATPDGQGRIDVALIRENYSIAVEVAVTNTVENEIHNIRKCLTAGYDKVVVCSNDPVHLDAIQKSFLTAEIAGDVGFYNPEGLVSFIQSTCTPVESQETVVKGYKVKVQLQNVSDAERITKGQSVIKAILRKRK